MPLNVLPMRLIDFDVIIAHATLFEPGDDLVGPPIPFTYPVATRAQASRRLRFAMDRQRTRFQEDPTARYIKVVETCPDAQDPHDGDIVSMARWHFYPDGYCYDSMVHWELAGPAPVQDEVTTTAAFNHELHDFILDTRDRARAAWAPKGSRAWFLMHMVTRRTKRGLGAAGMLIRWGTERADADGATAYLEAAAAAKPLYERYGFGEVGEIVLDLGRWGHEVPVVFAQMKRMSGEVAV